jgi:hypothetical protein
MTTPGATMGPSPPPPTVTPASTHVAKKPRLEAAAAATNTTEHKLHPTGKTPGFLGDGEGGITLYFIDECEDEPAATFFAHMDKRGKLWSMQAQKLGLECPKFLRKFLRKCIAAGNPMIIFREEDDGLQNNVHLEIWEAMKEKAEETDEELDDDMFATELHDLVDNVGLKFKHEHECAKTCAQPYDVKIQVYRRN